MDAPNPLEPWMIHHIEQQRRIRQQGDREGARIPLHPPEPPPPSAHRPERNEPRSVVIVIDLA